MTAEGIFYICVAVCICVYFIVGALCEIKEFEIQKCQDCECRDCNKKMEE